MLLTPLIPLASSTRLSLPVVRDLVPGGFPSPAEGHIDRPLDLVEYLVSHPSATYFCRLSGHSMEGLGIHDGDLLIVDRALAPAQGNVVVASIEGELTCKVLDLRGRQLVAASPEYPPIDLSESLDAIIEGVVTFSIRSHRCSR